MDDYAQIDKPCLILMGDRDKMVTLEETLQVYKAVPGAQLPGQHNRPGFIMSILTDLSDSVTALAETTGARVIAVRHPEGGQSSGFIWRTGLAVMAEETLAGEEEVEAVLPDGRAVTAKIAGRDPTTDVALLALDTGEFADWGQSPLPKPGSFALVAGRSETSLIARLASIVSV
eukprot:gene16013-21701_t